MRVTREMLTWLEKKYEAAKLRPSENAGLRDWTLRSLKQAINQLKEEIVRIGRQVDNPARGS